MATPNSVDRKIVSAERLAQTLAAERAGRTIVQCHGCFDIVHPGHVRYLQSARALGDVLIVSLTGDAGVAKGADRPYIPEELRAENLAALEFVSWVVIDPHPTACELLERIRPDVYVKGREYEASRDPRFERERAIVERHGGRVVFHSGDVVFSSTRLIAGMSRDLPLEQQRLAALCRRNGTGRETIDAAMGRIRDQRVVVVGDALRERYVYCDAGPAAEDAPVLSLRRLGGEDFCGGAAATALQLRALGARPLLVCARGSAEDEALLRSRLESAGVPMLMVQSRAALVQRTSFVSDDQKVFKVSEGGETPLDSAATRRAGAEIDAALDEAAALLWCDHGGGLIAPGLIKSVAPRARQRGVLMAGHAPGGRGQLAALHGCDLLVATERTLRESLHDMNTGLPALVWTLLDRAAGCMALISMRKRGVIAFDGRGAAGRPEKLPERLRSDYIPATAMPVVDALGADEALLAAAALALAAGVTLPVAAYLAVAAETLACSRIGPVPPTAAELEMWFEHRPELRVGSRFVEQRAGIREQRAGNGEAEPGNREQRTAAHARAGRAAMDRNGERFGKSAHGVKRKLAGTGRGRAE